MLSYPSQTTPMSPVMVLEKSSYAEPEFTTASISRRTCWALV